MTANIATCSHDKPLKDPNPHIKKLLIFSDEEKYCMVPINAPAKPESINPKITKELDDLTRDAKIKIKNKATIDPRNEAQIINHGLFKYKSNPINEHKNITMATPKLAIDVTPNTEGSANGFLNNSCIKNPAIGNATPTKHAVIDLGNL